MPMIYPAFDMNRVDAIQATLIQIPKISHLIEYHMIKSAIVPRLQVICLGATNSPIRYNHLLCHSQLLPVLHKEIITSNVIPTLDKLSSVDRSPSISVHDCIQLIPTL